MNTIAVFVGMAGVLATVVGVLIVIVLREMVNLQAQNYRLKPEDKLEALKKLEACYLIGESGLQPSESTKRFAGSENPVQNESLAE
ncbi:hypothetical protein IQ264_08960 [Phormidium sp. LEGE 05292]|uniref:hypothetical protein n=1 Tax=[Phormidium] sp. LEGE 05292 TaxID=767427 RepID=UPI00187E68D4|nr:hypothetical protein [Phormidium sp. LEGE 05292]MBE9225548.1 hypothetical protein [Phormidium sp. LEGE 05292]